jgi:uncharacterized OB-fold protein
VTDTAIPVPVVSDVDTAGFWRATELEQLAILVCEDCGQVLHLPKAFCHNCGSWNTTWKSIRPQGHVYSWTTVHRQIHPAFAVPYTIILVELENLPSARLIGHLPGTPELVAGMATAARFVDIGGATLPVWELADSTGHSVEQIGADAP